MQIEIWSKLSLQKKMRWSWKWRQTDNRACVYEELRELKDMHMTGDAACSQILQHNPWSKRQENILCHNFSVLHSGFFKIIIDLDKINFVQHQEEEEEEEAFFVFFGCSKGVLPQMRLRKHPVGIATIIHFFLKIIPISKMFFYYNLQGINKKKINLVKVTPQLEDMIQNYPNLSHNLERKIKIKTGNQKFNKSRNKLKTLNFPTVLLYAWLCIALIMILLHTNKRDILSPAQHTFYKFFKGPLFFVIRIFTFFLLVNFCD